MGHSAEGITADMLQHVSRFFLTDATLKAANGVVVNFHHRLGFSGLWGAGTMSSSDGQRFGIQASSLLASFYPRYFGYERAVTLYTHTSDQYSVFGTRAISCSAREALYVLDGLLENDNILRPREHSTDTHVPNSSSAFVTCWAIPSCRGCGISLTNSCIASTLRALRNCSGHSCGPVSISPYSANNGISWCG